MRYSGQIAPFLPSTAPLSLRLPQAVYENSSPVGVTSTGPGLSVPMGDFDSGGDALPITGYGRPLRALKAPVGRTAGAPAVPSWVVTSRGLSSNPLAGSDCACSGGMGAFDLSFKNPLVTGALVLAGLWFITKKSKR